MLHGRKTTATVAATLIALLTALLSVAIGLSGAETASAKPDLKTVKKQVEKLDQQAEAASERYNDARVKVAQTRVRLKALSSDLSRQQAVVDSMREEVAELVVDQFQGDALSATSQLVLSDDLSEDDIEDLLDEPPEGAQARFTLRIGQAAAFAEAAEELVSAGRPPCRLCGRPIGAEGHACPRWN